ncbi:MAG: proteasome assembly chaperone family protein [Candidatus Lokiarchaeota archaeon]|nr:proteasome assembly chaperone family protein [Candidatus Lokiarchaeota archaeon]
MKEFSKENLTTLPAKDCKLVVESGKLDLVKNKHPVLIVGFLGSGLVGNIVVSEFIKQLEMEQIGFVTTNDLPPIAIFYDGILKHPFRLYYSSEKNIVVAQCEVPFNKSATYQDLARLLSGWALEIGIVEVCAIQGLTGSSSSFPPENPPVYVAAEKEILERLKKESDVEILPRGLVLGPEAAILNEGLSNRLNCYALLVPVTAQIPNPEGASAVINELNQIYDLSIDTSKLMEDAHRIRKKLKELSEKTQQQHAQMSELSNLNPSERIYM